MNKQLKLMPEQAAVVAAIQRVTQALNLEAMQLAQIYKQEGTAEVLLEASRKLDDVGKTYVRDVQRVIQVATEMPNGFPPA